MSIKDLAKQATSSVADEIDVPVKLEPVTESSPPVS